LVDAQRLSEFMEDENILTRIKVENYLLVQLGARPCSLMTLPAELPNGEAMGSAIDGIVSPKLSLVRGEADPRRRLSYIRALKKEMRKAYHDAVEGSNEFKSHINWIRRLGLRSRKVEVRPTVRELYIFRDRAVENGLKKLMKERDRLRKRAYSRPSPQMDRIHFAYPEEFHGAWLREMGATLGYPSCCVDAYASERDSGVNVEERASRQIEDLEKAGRVDPFAYFVGYFFPCAPDCGAASALGRECQERLRELHPSLEGVYASMVAENLERVRRQPEVIAKYRAHAEMSRRGPN
jgi:hypothetical protein